MVKGKCYYEQDQIYDVYYGNKRGNWSQEIARRRIDFIVDNCLGPSVLDVGCSQGVSSILLGKKGLEVIGLDKSKLVINKANDFLKNEPKYIQNRVKFINLDFNEYKPNKKFNTIILGELIEHIDDPEKLIINTKNIIQENGRVIITTPFGYLPHPGHKQIFTLSSFVKLIDKYYTPEQLFIRDNYIYFIGVNKFEIKRINWKDFGLNKLMCLNEEGLIESQKYLYKHIDKNKKNYQKSEKELTKIQTELESSKKESEKIQYELRVYKFNTYETFGVNT